MKINYKMILSFSVLMPVWILILVLAMSVFIILTIQMHRKYSMTVSDYIQALLIMPLEFSFLYAYTFGMSGFRNFSSSFEYNQESFIRNKYEN